MTHGYGTATSFLSRSRCMFSLGFQMGLDVMEPHFMEMQEIIDDPMGTFNTGFDCGDRLQLISGRGGINSTADTLNTWMSRLQHQRHLT